MIDFLCARGKAIQDQDKVKKDQINIDMTNYVRKNADNFLNPTQVFIMLEQCDAIDWCHNEEIVELYGDETKLKEAFAPSEIIYENRSYTNATRGVKAFVILIILAIIFVITAYITGFIRDLVFQLD
jgi:hypothetical protein